MPTTKYLWNDITDTVAMEKDGAGNTTAVYASDPVPFGRLRSMRRGGTTYNYHFDGRGNATCLTDQTGRKTDAYTYDAFGTPRTATGNTENPYRYGGQHGYQYNQATGDYYVRARVYQPKRGRWTSKDPLRFADGLNAYVYAGNGPLNAIDPSGKELILKGKRSEANYIRRCWFWHELHVRVRVVPIRCVPGYYWFPVDRRDLAQLRKYLEFGVNRFHAMTGFDKRVYGASATRLKHQLVTKLKPPLSGPKCDQKGWRRRAFDLCALGSCGVNEMLAQLSASHYSNEQIDLHRTAWAEQLAACEKPIALCADIPNAPPAKWPTPPAGGWSKLTIAWCYTGCGKCNDNFNNCGQCCDRCTQAHQAICRKIVKAIERTVCDFAAQKAHTACCAACPPRRR